MLAKEVVKTFNDSDLANDPNVVPKFFHKDCELHQSSSHRFMLLKFNDIVDFFDGTRKLYHGLSFEFTHMIEADVSVITRYTLYRNTIENQIKKQYQLISRKRRKTLQRFRNQSIG